MRFLIIIILTSIASISHCQIDSTNYQLFKVGFDMLNDDNPFSNMGDYENRKTDDHGLTLMAGFNTEFNFRINKIKSRVFTNHYTSLFTKGFGTLSIIKEDNPDYNYFSYILTKHPDWDNILLYNQVAITKNVNSIYNINNYNNFLFGFGFEITNIDANAVQRGTNIQHTFHKTLKVRNYYHSPFTDSSVFKGDSFNYFSISPCVGYSFQKVTPTILLLSEPVLLLKYNLTDVSVINKIMPAINWYTSFSFGKNILAGKFKRFQLENNLVYNPNEILLSASDPGTIGYNRSSFSLIIAGVNSKKINTLKKYLFVYKLNPFEIALPVGSKNDLVFNYHQSTKRYNPLTGYFNFSAFLMFN